MACSTTTTTQVCLETITDVSTGTLYSQTVTCGACSSTSPVFSYPYLTTYVTFNVPLTVTVDDHLGVSCSPAGNPYI